MSRCEWRPNAATYEPLCKYLRGPDDPPMPWEEQAGHTATLGIKTCCYFIGGSYAGSCAQLPLCNRCRHWDAQTPSCALGHKTHQYSRCDNHEQRTDAQIQRSANECGRLF